MGYNLENISDYIKNTGNTYAHRKETGQQTEYESLTEHSDRTIKYFNIINKDKNLIERVKCIIKNIFIKCDIQDNGEKLEFVTDMFINAVYLHDIGKSNPGFQLKAMKNNIYKGCECEKKHSLLSALIFADIYIKKNKRTLNDKKLNIFVFMFSYIISRHHSALEDFRIDGFCCDLIEIDDIKNKMLLNYKDSIDNKNTIKNMYKLLDRHKTEYTYILGKLLFSVLVTCDFAATYEYMNNCEAEVTSRTDKTYLTERYNERELIRKIRSGKSETEINRLRTEIFLESEKNIIKDRDKTLFYLEAPTGSGKTNTSINLALNLLNNTDTRNIFYIFPFNTLAEQTAQVMEFWDNRKDFIVMNSVTPILESGRYDENTEYEKIYFDYQLANFPVVITSHIRFFNTLFGMEREETIWLYKLCNSVIILDEIQSYSNSLWSNFINILLSYAKALNIKIIIMSATLPRLDKLVNVDISNKVCDLIDAKRYFNSKVFKNRVKVDFSMLGGKIGISELLEKVINVMEENRGKKILVEFIKKASARDFYNKIKEYCDNNNINVAEISGDDNKFIRAEIISKIKNKEIDLLVATQVIEAGVDIDMDIGFKDISILDSEEQFMGRINRSCKGEGYVYFFDMDNEKNIYKNDVRVAYNLHSDDIRDFLSNKNFYEYYNKILLLLNDAAKGHNYNINFGDFRNSLCLYKFKSVYKSLKLIDNNSYQVVLNHTYYYNGVEYRGSDVWEKYKRLLKNEEGMGYAELMTKLSEIYEKLNMFTFNIRSSNEKREIHFATERIGNMFYFEDGSEYITSEGKFDRQKFKEERTEGIFI